ncbi:MAG: sodium:proton antiporter NhaD [Gammaproteobacteria bacterium]|nr:sodium:proton antiporter NhaD [Gammaproteobacteria bacterium]
MLRRFNRIPLALLLGLSQSSYAHQVFPVDHTRSGYAILALVVFGLAYLIVIGEEFLQLRKSKPMIISAGIIWICVALAYTASGQGPVAQQLFRGTLEEYAELMLFLLSAMTYINTLQERRVFLALRSSLVTRGLSLRSLFWLTGLLAFCISPLADNLTTALVMFAVVITLADNQPQFLVLASINLVVAANAGGVFTPFGDITTLMVWQKGKVGFFEFFDLFLPALVNWLIPALLMSLAVPSARPQVSSEKIQMLRGGYTVVLLFLSTIGLTVALHQVLQLPPVLGMMTGLGLLKIYGFFLRRAELASPTIPGLAQQAAADPELLARYFKPRYRPFDIFISIKRAEWDTLLFFYGVVLSVGGLGALGYLAWSSLVLYGNLGPTWANISIGVLSAVVDNIPVMYAVLNMQPDMPLQQWLLVTLTAGVGGSLLSIGSAAGVALMGQARGIYTFGAHMRWSWAIALGYAASIGVHLGLTTLH